MPGNKTDKLLSEGVAQNRALREAREARLLARSAALRDEGMSWVEIGRRLGISESVVRRLLGRAKDLKRL